MRGAGSGAGCDAGARRALEETPVFAIGSRHAHLQEDPGGQRRNLCLSWFRVWALGDSPGRLFSARAAEHLWPSRHDKSPGIAARAPAAHPRGSGRTAVRENACSWSAAWTRWVCSGGSGTRGRGGECLLRRQEAGPCRPQQGILATRPLSYSMGPRPRNLTSAVCVLRVALVQKERASAETRNQTSAVCVLRGRRPTGLYPRA